MRICLFPTQEAAQAALDVLHERTKALWAAAGYTVEGGSIVPKRGGVDAPEAQRTLQWDEVREHPQGGWHFTHPVTAFPLQAAALLTGLVFEDVDMED